jgi:hypothetical protein
MRTVPVAVAAVLLLAGCNAAPSLDGTTPTETVTPADVPADYDYAPGVTVDGVTEPATLAEAHERVLAETSYRITANRTVRDANGTLREQLLVDVAVADDRTFLASAATRGPAAPVFLGRPPANGTYWSNGSVYVRKLTRDGGTTYNEFEGPSSGAGTWRYWTRTVPFGGEQATPERFYRSLFAAVPTRVAGESGAGNATTYRLVGDAVVTERFQTEVTDVRDVRLTATVRQDGLVQLLTLRYVGEVDGTPVRVERTVRYRDVGTTAVERPPWFEKAVGG